VGGINRFRLIGLLRKSAG